MVEKKKDLLAFTFGWRLGFPGNSAGKESACNAGDPGSIPGSGRRDILPWRRDRLPTLVFLGSHGDSDGKESAWNAEELGSVLGRSPRGVKGNPLQFLAQRIPRDRGALSYKHKTFICMKNRQQKQCSREEV